MILSDLSIDLLAKSFCMIEPYDRKQLQPASYDVRLGDKMLICEITDRGAYFDPSTRDLFGAEWKEYDIHDEYFLKPHEFALASTYEELNIPGDIVARFEGKSTLGRMGLTTHITAGFIDPGFIGNVTLELHNDSPIDIRLVPGMFIGQLSFERVDHPVYRPYGSSVLNSHYQHQCGPRKPTS